MLDYKAATMLKRANPELYAALARSAAENGVTVTFLLTEAVSRYLGDDEKMRFEALRDIDRRITAAKQKTLDEYNEIRRATHSQEVNRIEDLPEEFSYWPVHFK